MPTALGTRRMAFVSRSPAVHCPNPVRPASRGLPLRTIRRAWLVVPISAAVLLLSSRSDLRGHVGAVEVEPGEPREGDVVRARVRGEFPDGCWSFLGHEVNDAGGNIQVRVLAERGEGPCPAVVVPYEFLAELGALGAGTYHLAVEDALGSRTLDFTVQPVEGMSAGGWVPGDANGDSSRDIADPVFILVHLFAGGPPPLCDRSANANADGELDVADAIYLLDHFFRGGGPPVIPSVECLRAEHCADREWLVDCLGHWTCDCGACRPACDFDGCGDGKCDWARGETHHTCPEDCKAAQCPPTCLHIGTRSEGWHDPCTGERYRWERCAERTAECRHCGSKSEGWYDSVTGELIAWGDCDCE